MLASALTITVIAAIIVGVSVYAYRRVAKVSRENAARTAAHEARLLAEVTANAPQPSQQSFTKRAAPITNSVPEVSATPETSPVAPVPLVEPVPLVAPVPAHTAEPAQPASVQDEIRAFLGEPSDDPEPDLAGPEPTQQPEAAPEAGPETARSSFDTAADELAHALREAAALVEKSAAEPGTPQERAARTLLAVTTAIGALPLASLVANEDPPH